uniref:60S acidic ribosomal protein P0 n=1 Tax=Stygiella incarcerata TaxID=1712417 RepID=A0A192ZIH4_9EUKA|nr:60S acidic ribosomal protein P0-3 [Stygiella incarcerata]|eukprot:TRINITY_DN1939_c0_g1_i1.p1 TRINITY_DN1939_c0_g1~~TRINITY_DN1939_c0_g1_i1.p1  ORF type:complete len:311 (-),score=93.43 TRINITY_DN1939_c0_g1_i1:74-1006(-)
MVVSEKKKLYGQRVVELLESHSRILLVGADNVGSKQFQNIRRALRGKATVLMGKNTLIRKIMKGQVKKMPFLNKLMPYIVGNIGLVFINEGTPINEVRDVILQNKEDAPARAGAISPCEVVIPPMNTGLEPTKTSFFQALNISTKITRGTVEIINPVNLLNVGDKVGNSEAMLLQMLNINPFKYGLSVELVCDEGELYDPEVLDMTDDDYIRMFQQGVGNVCAVSLATDVPTEPAIPHLISAGFRNVLGVCVEIDYDIPAAETIKAFLADPTAFAVAAPVEVKEEKVEEAAPQEEEEEESDDDMGFGLFD